MKIVFSPKCVEYQFPGHLESPSRVLSSYEFLKDTFEFTKPSICKEKDLRLVHTENLIKKVKKNDFFDFDTPNIKNIYNYALLSVGGAVKAAQLALKGVNSFSLMRPPGHHAGRDFLGGFCYFNNIAVAVKKIQQKRSIRIAICDFDVHHGNGTQDIFFGEENVLYVSLHQAPLFPGTGLKTENNCINFPLPPGTRHKEYLKIFQHALKIIRDFEPEFLAISAGFDAYEKDTISHINLKKETYKKIGILLSDLKIPTFAVLEGGYSNDLKFCIYNFLKGIEKE
jgi:acetoin utilization deacetylase AcuC-like enzyme